MNEFIERSKADITLPYAVNDVCCILLPYRNVSCNQILGWNKNGQIDELIKIANTKKKDYFTATTKFLRVSSVFFRIVLASMLQGAPGCMLLADFYRCVSKSLRLWLRQFSGFLFSPRKYCSSRRKRIMGRVNIMGNSLVGSSYSVFKRLWTWNLLSTPQLSIMAYSVISSIKISEILFSSIFVIKQF